MADLPATRGTGGIIIMEATKTRLYWLRECMLGPNGEIRRSCWIKVQYDWCLKLMVNTTYKRGHWLEWKQRFSETGGTYHGHQG